VTNAASQPSWRENPPAGESLAYPLNPAAVGDGPAGDLARYTPGPLLGLSVQHYPAVGICVVTVQGELDLLTAPLLEQRVREQLAAAPTHLILDLEPVRFLGSSGLNCLLRARELAGINGVQLHLTGLITGIVARTVESTGLIGVFSSYPTLVHAVIELVGRPDATTSDNVIPAPVLTVLLCCSVGSIWALELREFDPGTGLGALIDWISSGVPVTQPEPDTQAHELLAARGLWLFRDSSARSLVGSRHRIGYACSDAELITLAHLVRDDAIQAGLHPVMLAAWIRAGYSVNTAEGWIRAGCLFPR
jgi:anti-sigma B factor antagonist